MPTPLENHPSPSRRAPCAGRRQAGGLLAQVATLLFVVSAIALAIVVLRSDNTDGPTSPGFDAREAPAAAKIADSPDEPALGAPGSTARPVMPTPRAGERAGAETDPLDLVSSARSATASSEAVADAVTDEGASAPRLVGRGDIGQASGSATGWASGTPRATATATALPGSAPVGLTRLGTASSGAPTASGSTSPSLAADRAAVESPASAPSPPALRARSRAEVIESSKRLHEMRLEALRQSGQLPPDA